MLQVFTPAYYIQYFKLMHTWIQQGVKMDAEMIHKAQAFFATVGVDGEL
jgi:hypothetical protein